MEVSYTSVAWRVQNRIEKNMTYAHARRDAESKRKMRAGEVNRRGREPVWESNEHSQYYTIHDK